MDIKDAEARLRDLSPLLAKILDPKTIALDLTVTPIKSSITAATFEVYLAGKRGIVKMFAADKAAAAALNRERTALVGFHQAGVPKLLLVSEKDNLIMTSFIAGKSVNDIVTADTLMRTAEHMGQWFGNLANHAPEKEASDNWDSYLENYDEGFNQDVLNKNAGVFQSVEISKLTLAHNDNVLSNFIIGLDSRLYGIDFEDARFKPEGWDLVTAAQSLMRKFPEELPVISTSLLRGYQLTAKDCGLPDHFDQIINLLAVARAVSNAPN